MMHFLQLTLLYCLLNIFSGKQTLEPSPETRFAQPKAEMATTNIILQSKDGGETWQDISEGLPQQKDGDDYFTNNDGLYVNAGDRIYHNKPNSNVPFWNEEYFLYQDYSITPGKTGMFAFNLTGKLLYKPNGSEAWSPLPTDVIIKGVRTVFETTNGTVFIGSDNGLYRSTDKGKNWKQIQNGGWGMNIVESEGVLIGTGQKGIIRSADNGEHWEWVISGEGGVGIAVERIEGGFAAISYSGLTQSRRIRISVDGGTTWKAIDESLQPSKNISSVKQLGGYLFVGHPDGVFRSSDMGKTWNVVHSGVDQNEVKDAKIPNTTDSSVTKTRSIVATDSVFNPNASARDTRRVFKIYVSGNIVYAVARHAGC
jgi:photosystem II stability/assembly factor-like uncharacterized protein